MRGAAKTGPTAPVEGDALAALALIAHELNNIAVPLNGFAEHAQQHVPPYGVVRECLQELQIGIGRISALAADLESLGETGSVPEVIGLGDCIGKAIPEKQRFQVQIEWCCPEDITVRVDPMHAQRAVAALLRVALAGESNSYPVTVSITARVSGVRECAVCGASLRRHGHWVFVVASGIRRLNRGVLRDPLGSDGGGRTSRRLAFAVLERCAHRTGAHISLDDNAEHLTLALPVS